MEELLSFIEVADLQLSRPAAVLTLVQAALDECPEEDPRFPFLVQIEEDLLAGTVPQGRLQAFAARFPRQTPVSEDLESEFRSMAAQFGEEEWRTPAFVELENALLDFEEDGDLDALLGMLQSRDEKIRESLDGYRATNLTPEEVTAETVTGHRLLCDGLEAWLGALGALAEAAESGTAWDAGLEAAERGNRLLLAVQRLNQRVASQASNVK